MDLYQWAQSNLKSISFCYVTKEEHAEEVKLLEERFRSARTILGTRTMHAFIPKDRMTLTLKTYSSDSEGTDRSICRK